MNTILETDNFTVWLEQTRNLTQLFDQNNKKEEDAFVEDNYTLLKEHKYFSAMIPEELGGGGLSYEGMCEVIKLISFHCSSTGLALSMHQHLLAAMLYRYKAGLMGDEVLKKIASQQLILVSTGAGDWLESNGHLTRVEGGFLFTGQKRFASQAAVGNILITSGRYEESPDNISVLHFSLPMNSPGITIIKDWEALGMRGTGSHTIKLQEVFIPDTAITLKRAAGKYHPVWNIVLTVAMPLIMSAYVGVAEKAYAVALGHCRKNKTTKDTALFLTGEINNQLTNAQVMLKDMIRLTNEFSFKPDHSLGNAILTRKTIAAKACIQTVETAMQLVGGSSYYRSFALEKLLRDVHGVNYHPLPEMSQLRFSGEYLLESGNNE